MSKNSKKTTEMPEEVEDFIESENRIEEFRAKHFKVFSEYSQLLEMRNAALIAADQKVRALGEPFGPWAIHSKKVDINAEALYDIVGRDTFLKIGGEVKTKKVFSIPKDKLEAAAALKQIPKQVVEQVRTEKIAFSAPKPGNLV